MSADDPARFLPHGGRMRLIERVESWDESQIVCLADNHRAPDHPLRGAGGLAAVHAVEYAAQATAVHGGLVGGAEPGLRYVAAIRDAALAVDRLDDLPAPLRIEARHAAGNDAAVVYACEVTSGGFPVAAVRLTLVAVRGIPS
ncbi:MAG: hypothetical protein KDG89_05920 [Geminicoccaceae bacterium]|nr:hypothetical protein [Geminicoccaceae bacterium]